MLAIVEFMNSSAFIMMMYSGGVLAGYALGYMMGTANGKL